MFNCHDGSASESSAVESELKSVSMPDVFFFLFADSISSKINNTNVYEYK